MTNLFLLIAGHYVVDFGLQSDWMAKNKVPGQSGVWIHVLAAHCFMQGLTVYLVTQVLWLSLAEIVAHAAIDTLKGTGKIEFHSDQALHLVCRCAWWLLAGSGIWSLAS